MRALLCVTLAALAGPVDAADAADGDRGRQLATTVCTACHGETGNSVVPTFPKLAGMKAEYIAKQLRDYMAGRRVNPVMSPIAATLQPADVPALAAYYAAQAPQLGTTPADAAQAQAGRQIFEAGNAAADVPGCVGCHQAGGTGDARYPRLAGQHPAYSADQLAQFKSGTRANDKAHVMRAIAGRLTEQEIEAVSAYLAGL